MRPWPVCRGNIAGGAASNIKFQLRFRWQSSIAIRAGQTHPPVFAAGLVRGSAAAGLKQFVMMASTQFDPILIVGVFHGS
jgi:hypothetical protein